MLHFVSSNYNKFREVKRILDAYKIDIEFVKEDLLEIQADSLEEVAEYKVKDAFSKINDEVLIEDDGLFIDALNDFPGIYSSYVYKTIGNDGILKLMNNIDNRIARFVSIIAYSNGLIKLFKGVVYGRIADHKEGSSWGYDPIFIPNNYTRTYAELYNKDKVSHRNLALSAFAEWYNKNKKI